MGSGQSRLKQKSDILSSEPVGDRVVADSGDMMLPRLQGSQFSHAGAPMQPKREVIPVRDEDGNSAEIIRITPFQRNQTLSGVSWEEGLATLITAKGERINPLPDGSYQEVNSPHRRYWPA